MPPEPLAAGVLRQQRATVKRVDNEIVCLREPAPGRTSQQEVSWKIHAFDVYAGPPRDFHIDQRQRDRDAGAPIQMITRV